MMNGIKMEQLSGLMGEKEIPLSMQVETVNGENGMDEDQIAMSVLDEFEQMISNKLLPAIQKLKENEGA